MINTNAERQSRWRREWSAVTLVLAALAFVLGWSGWTWRLDQTFYDTAMSVWRKPVPNDMVVIAIDDESLSAIGRWPWKRSIHARAVDIIAEAQPKAILLDLLLSEPELDPEQDRALADALRRAGSIVLPVTLAGGPMGIGHELAPIPAFAQAVRLGHADAELDNDGVMRWMYLRAGWEEANRPHIALAMLEAGGEAIHHGIARQLSPEAPHRFREQTWRRDQRIPISFLGPPGSIPHISYSALLRGEVSASSLAGKYVFIGVTAVGLGDRHLTPVTYGGERMASVEIVAQEAQMLRSGSAVRIAPPLAVGLASASLVLILMAACWRLSPRRSLAICAALALLLPLTCQLGMGLGLWFPPSSFVIMALLTYPIWSWRRLEVTVDFVSGELGHLVQQSKDGAAPWMKASNSPDDQHSDERDYLEQQFSAIKSVASRLDDARQLMTHVLSGLPNAVIVTDRWGSVQHANDMALALIECEPFATRGDAIRHSISQRLAKLHPRQAPDWGWMVDRVLIHGQTLSVEVVGDGDVSFLAGLAPLQGFSGNIEGCVICLTDIGDLKRAERQRDELLGFIAHDIRSPQASLISLAQLQRLTPPMMSSQEAMDQIEQLARSTVSLCEELLQVMRAESHPLKREPLCLADTMATAIQEIEPQAQARGVILQMTTVARNSAILGDAALVRRALVNLINNAIKFSPERGKVTLSLAEVGEYAVISVTDQGPGIPPSDLARLFKRFERVEASEALKSAPGIGLGLVFIDTVATRHGGKVEVRSTPGVGSTFEFWLPLDALARQAA
jgi:CHASE2 domain-containing sensor protein/signal transduction histidine kinase